jgi:Domain of unknown function (DUF5122) beta-propeller
MKHLRSSIILSLSLLLAIAARAQPSLNALLTPNVELLRAGRVLEMERLADGKLLLGGDFIRVGALPRAGIARLNINGSVDTSYVPTVSAEFGLQQLLTDSSGRSYLLNGGSLRRLTPTGELDTGFTSVSFNFTFARSMALVSDGIIVGGDFSTVGLQNLPRAGLVKIRFDGSVDPNFIVNTTDVTTVISAGMDEVLVAGGFTSIGGVARTGIAKLSTAGAGLVLSNWNPILNNAAGAVRLSDALIAAGSVYLTGTFDTVAGVSRVRLAKVSLSAGAILDSAWNIRASGVANARLFQHNGSLLVSTSNFSFYANPPAVALPGRRLMRAALTGTGTIDAGFAPVIQEDGAGTAVAVAPGDNATRMVIGGSFIGLGNSARFALAQLNADGSLDTVSALVEAADLGAVSQIAVDSVNQRTYLSGNFLRADGAALRYCLRLDANGNVDTNWRPQTDDRVNPAIAVVPGSGVWVGINAGIVRLNESDGLQVSSWVNNTGSVFKLLAANAAIYAVSGSGLLRFPIANNGVADAAFVPAANSNVDQIRFDSAGNSLLVSGAFSQIGGGNRARLARLNVNTGALISSFDPNFNDISGQVGLQGFDLDGLGGVWVAGNFNSVNGIARNSPVRLRLSDGEIDSASAPLPNSTFNLGLGFSDGFFYGERTTFGGNAELKRVPSIGASSDPSWRIQLVGVSDAIAFDSSRVLLGGSFTQIGQSPRLGLASVPKVDVMLRDGFE